MLFLTYKVLQPHFERLSNNTKLKLPHRGGFGLAWFWLGGVLQPLSIAIRTAWQTCMAAIHVCSILPCTIVLYHHHAHHRPAGVHFGLRAAEVHNWYIRHLLNGTSPYNNFTPIDRPTQL